MPIFIVLIVFFNQKVHLSGSSKFLIECLMATGETTLFSHTILF